MPGLAAFSSRPASSGGDGRAVAEGLFAGGVAPVSSPCLTWPLACGPAHDISRLSTPPRGCQPRFSPFAALKSLPDAIARFSTWRSIPAAIDGLADRVKAIMRGESGSTGSS